MEFGIIILICLAGAFWLGKFWQRHVQSEGVQFVENVRRGMEFDLQASPFAGRIDELRASDFFKFEYIKEFRNAYIVVSVAKELDLAPRVVAENIVLGRFLGRADENSVQLLGKQVNEFRKSQP